MSTKKAIRTTEDARAYLGDVLDTLPLQDDGETLKFPNPCGRCGGSGYGYWHQDGGRCYECGGANTLKRVRRISLKAYVQKEKRTATIQAKRVADRKAEREAIALEAAAFLEAHPELAAALQTDNPTTLDLAEKLQQWGSLSDAQVELALKIAERKVEAKVPVPVDGERIEVEGEIISEKEHESAYGYSTKLTVKVTAPDGVYLLWGTCPTSLFDAIRAEYEPLREAWLNTEEIGPMPERRELRGSRVHFAATVTRSDRDESFGFFKRPTKARFI